MYIGEPAFREMAIPLLVYNLKARDYYYNKQLFRYTDII